MEKTVRTLIVFLMVLSICELNAQTFTLRESVSAANATCPLSMGALGECVKITYTNNIVTYYYSINETLENITELRKNPQNFKKTILVSLSNPVGDLKRMVSMCVDEGASMRFVHTGKTSGMSVSAIFSPSELRICLEDREVTDEDKLNEMIRVSALQIPMEMAVGLIMSDVKLEENNLIYSFTYDSSMYNFEQASYQDMKSSILQTIQRSSEAELAQFKIVCSCKKGIIYRYVNGTTGKKRDVTISYNEIKECIK